jgi:hypothetical protein
MAQQCPQWVYETNNLKETQVRQFFDPYFNQTIYAVGPHEGLMPQKNGKTLSYWFLMWYDSKGKFLKQTSSQIPTYYLYIGRCRPRNLCVKPQWIEKKFPKGSFGVTMYKHRKYGTVYAVASFADAGTMWYDTKGRYLHRSPVYGWEKPSKETVQKDELWTQSVTFIDRC